MSEFNPDDYAGDDGKNRCPNLNCGEERPGAELDIHCGHDGCKSLMCSRCSKLCKSCSTVRCDEHMYRTTYQGMLSIPIDVCSECRNEELDEIAEAQEAHVE